MWNTRLRLMQLVESVRDLSQYGPAKPAAEHGLDEVRTIDIHVEVSLYLNCGVVGVFVSRNVRAQHYIPLLCRGADASGLDGRCNIRRRTHHSQSRGVLRVAFARIDDRESYVVSRQSLS